MLWSRKKAHSYELHVQYCLCPFKQKVKEDNKGNPPKIVQKEEEENGGTVQYKDGV